jgi:hypothetical protein
MNDERVAPGLNPGALWIRQATLERVLAEHPLGPGNVNRTGERDLDRAAAWATAFGMRVWTWIYDGDTGECLATLIYDGATSDTGPGQGRRRNQ